MPDEQVIENKTHVLQLRTKHFAIRIVNLYRALPRNGEGQVIGKQILRSGTSVGANYRAACRSRSRRDFVSKLGIVLEEADETAFWLELLAETGVMPAERLHPLLEETKELTRIFSAARHTTQVQLKDQKSKIENRNEC
jgi:four helix bundle protein